MTCIAGLLHEGSVYIGGDSAGVGGYDLTIRADQKVFRNGPMLFGFTNSFRMGQLLRFAFRPPLHDPSLSDEAYMVTAFIDAVRYCLKNGGYARAVNGEESGGTFLVAYHGGLYEINNDYQVGIPADGYAAVGCGASYALGSLYSTVDKPPEERVQTALSAAERMSAGVRGPFNVLRLEADG